MSKKNRALGLLNDARMMFIATSQPHPTRRLDSVTHIVDVHVARSTHNESPW